MNILIVGFGSIGQRHLNNLMLLYPENKYFVVTRSTQKGVIKDCQIICDSIYDYYKDVTFMSDINQITNLDIAFICNNSSDHIRYAILLATRGVHLFIEKPLAINLEGVNTLRTICIEKRLICMIGFQTKFHPIYNKIKSLLVSEKINFVNSKWLTYLPNWHKYEDYKSSYAASKNKGGGVALTMIHDLDMLNSLFSNLRLVNSILGNYSCLDIDAEDYLMANFISNNIPISLNLSFSQIHEERIISISTNCKTIMVNFIANDITIVNLDGSKSSFTFNIDRNDLFVKEIQYFFKAIEGEIDHTINTLDESMKLQIIVDKILRTGGKECMI